MRMKTNGHIGAVFEDGVLKLDVDPGVPEHTRVVIAIQRFEAPRESQARAQQEFHQLRELGGIQLDGWRPTRDDMHERD